MLIAGIIPGGLLTGMFLVYVLIRVRLDPRLAPDVSADLADRTRTGGALTAFARMIPSALVFFMVMGLIMLGVATPTEAAATGVLGALMLALMYGRLNFRMVKEALFSAARPRAAAKPAARAWAWASRATSPARTLGSWCSGIVPAAGSKRS